VKTRLFFLLLLSFALLLTVSPMIYAADGDPSIRIAQEDGGNGSYKLVVTATASAAIGPIVTASIAIAYDNTVIVPVDAHTGAIISETLTNQDAPFKTALSAAAGIVEPIWVTSGNKTTFDVTAMTQSARNIRAGAAVIEFYFKLQNGKTTADMNAGTFTLVIGPTITNGSAMLGAADNTIYVLDYTGEYNSKTKELFLSSFKYTNSSDQSGDVADKEPAKTPPASTGSSGGGSGGTSAANPALNANETADNFTTPIYLPMPPLKDGEVMEATKTNNPLFLDEKETVFPAVKISGYNWLKLRDFALILNGSAKQFSINYDANTNIIDIITGQVYQPLGDELTDKLADVETAISSQQLLRVNGEHIKVAAYNIKGYNYFRLRDLAIILNFAVIYDDDTGKIELDFANPYKE